MNQQGIVEAFRVAFGHDPEIAVMAPGRLNLIGEHTDYNDGFCMPVAIDRYLYLAASRTSGESKLISTELGAGDRFDATTVVPPPSKTWTKYPAGMAWAMRGQGSLSNLEAAVGSDVPIASRVSSSAAIEMAFGIAWNALDELNIEQKEIALTGQRCENGFIGVRSGNMDQLASAMGKVGHALLIDCRSLDIRYVPIPENLVVAMCDTRVSKELVGSEYNDRRDDCEAAARILNVPKLRDATLEMLEESRSELGDRIYRRARHIITDNQRCLEFAEALTRGDEAAIGQLMEASHISMRDNFEITVPEINAMREAAANAPGCVGARMTGGGFGGACVALVRRSSFPAFQEQVQGTYLSETGIEGNVVPCEPAEGAHVAIFTKKST